MDVILTVANYMKENVDDGILTDIGFKLLENNFLCDYEMFISFKILFCIDL